MIRLSREADYSLLAMTYIASRPEGELAYRRDIAAHYSIPREFLAKVLQKLSRAGLIVSSRGTQGGYRLAREASLITLADMVQAVDGPMALVVCQKEPCMCPQEPACTVQSTLNEVQREIRKVFEGVSLQEMRGRCDAQGGHRPDLLTVGGVAR
ncbi:MAG TPA: Rrf2 family transcriptional regulator [Candidatus Polarisedimenticolia bacterium]|nr:Rrf2 family transcriptional regulator [Candidatus Polarisedimenticolia bacterium]